MEEDKVQHTPDPEKPLVDEVEALLKDRSGPKEVIGWMTDSGEFTERGHAFDYLQKPTGGESSDLRKSADVDPPTPSDDPFESYYEPLRKAATTKPAPDPSDPSWSLPDTGSKQIKSDFLQQSVEAGAGTLTVIRPPYSLDQLLYLRELQPLHSAALEQLVADVVGNGFIWKPKVPDATDDEIKGAIDFVDEPNPEMTFLEIMQSVWLDRRTLGFGAFEVVRDGGGKVTEIWHVPAHTLRIRFDNERFLQQRSGKMVWFKKWGDKRHLSAITGEWSEDPLPEDEEANELFLFKMPTGRSSYYPIPGYVSAIGSISTAIALHDYNRTFFTRYAIPSWAIILEGAELTASLKTTIETYFKNEVRGNPHRVLTLNLPYFPVRQTGENRVKVTFTRLSDQVKDMSFRYLNQAVSLEILIAHRMPPYRVGWPITGSLGGSSAREMNVMYKTGVVNPEQAIFRARMTKFFRVEFGVKEHEFDVTELDITDAQQDMSNAVNGLKGTVLLLDEARQAIGLHPLPGGEGQVLVLPGGFSLYNPKTRDFKTALKAGGESIENAAETGGETPTETETPAEEATDTAPENQPAAVGKNGNSPNGKPAPPKPPVRRR